MPHSSGAMLDNNTASNKRAQWTKKWKNKKEKIRRAVTQDYDATLTHQHHNGADCTAARPSGIKITFHPQVTSDASDSCSSQPAASAATPQLNQKDEASLLVNYTTTKPEKSAESKKKTSWRERWKKKNKQQNSNMTSAPQAQSRPLHSSANVPLSRTVDFHPRPTSDQSSDRSAPSTAVTRSQRSSGTTTVTSTHSLPRFTARVQPPTTAATSNPCFPNAAAGPSNNHSSSQRTVHSFSPALPSKLLAIDCEMVGTGPKGRISQVARCSIVSYDGDIVYDKFIMPPVPITDYRTPWSGIRPHNLSRATPFAEARREILRLVRGKVLVGHAIHNDLKVLSYSHPKDLTRDTSRIPLLNAKAGFRETEVVSLKRLTKALFNRDIQKGRTGHSSVEDAKATMELYKLVEMEWEQSPA